MKNSLNKLYLHQMKQNILFLVCAALFSILILFIDEGRYSLNFFSDKGNLVFFFIFTGIFFAGQFTVSRIISNYPGRFKLTHNIILGIPLGFFAYYILIFLFFMIKKIL